MKTDEQLAEEKARFNHGHPVQIKAAQHAKDKSNDYGVQVWTENSFIVGYNEGYQDGYSAGFESAMKIHDWVFDYLQKTEGIHTEIIQHEPLLPKYTKEKKHE